MAAVYLVWTGAERIGEENRPADGNEIRTLLQPILQFIFQSTPFLITGDYCIERISAKTCCVGIKGSEEERMFLCKSLEQKSLDQAELGEL